MAWKYIRTYLFGMVFLYLQLLLMPAFEMGKVIPNILIPWLLYLIWTRELKVALIVGFIIGLMYDATQPLTFGLNALIFVLLCVSIDMFRQPFETESKVAKILTIALANIIFHLIQWLIFGVIYAFDTQLMLLNLISFFYNLGITFVVFWLIQFLSRLRVVVVSE
ncbi:MAG: rod shape-determining protein MreD [Candidatus Cloacimonadaceae bacterium]|nr:rod shape-determining protein MreD [Candidatus Cloacimonadaceae bacterium]